MRLIIAWLQQPTTLAGLSAVTGALLALATGQITWPQAVPLLAGALVAMVVPDNSMAKEDAEALASALANRFFNRKGSS